MFSGKGGVCVRERFMYSCGRVERERERNFPPGKKMKRKGNQMCIVFYGLLRNSLFFFDDPKNKFKIFKDLFCLLQRNS